MAFDVQGAIAAGHKPSAILDFLAQDNTVRFDIAGARKAGHTDDAILAELARDVAVPATPDTSFGSAFQQGLAQPVQNIGTTMRAVGIPGGATVEQAGKGMAPANYQPSQFDALTPGTWDQLPRAVVEQAGQLAGSIATRGAGAAVGGAVGGPVGAAVGGFAAPAVFGAAQVLGPIAMERAQSQGRTEPNDDDLRWAAATAAASGALDSLSLGAGKGASSMVGRIGRHAAAEGVTEGAQSGIEQAGATVATPGGVQVDPRRMLNEGVVGAATGGTVYTGTNTAGAARQSFSDFRAARRSGEAARQFQQETSQAEQAAQADPNAPPPSFDRLSPLAQQGAAELAALEMYQQRRKTETERMGRESATHDPSDTFKGLMDDVERNLRDVTGLMVRQGVIRSEDAKAMGDAIYEAKRHNRTTGEGGEFVSYFDTNRDRIANMPGLDPEARDTLLTHLRVLDVASENSLKRNAKGFLERHSGLITTAAGATIGSVLPGAGTLTAAVGGYLGRAGAVSVLRGIDRRMGNQLPPLLRKQESLEAFAKKHDLRPGTTAQDLMDLRDRLMASQAQQDTADADLDAQVASSTPEPVQGWSLGIARELGLRDRDVRAAVELLLPEDTAKALLARNTIPEVSMKRVTAMLREVTEDGTLGPLGEPRPDAPASGSVPQGQVDRFGNPIRSQSSYDATIQASQAAIKAVADNHPDLHPSAVAIGNARSRPEKRAVLAKTLSYLPASQQGRAQAVLAPLTEFGPTEAPASPTGPSAASQRSLRGTQGRGQGDPMTGRDITARVSQRSGPLAMLEARRNKRASTAPGEDPTVTAPRLEGLQKRVRMSDGSFVEPGPNREARQIAADYMREAGLPYDPPRNYVKVDEARAKRIAQAFESMKHEPENPVVAEAYRQMIAETVAQYQAIVRSGVEFTFMKPDGKGGVIDPYGAGGPRAAVEDINQNRRMEVFPTAAGFGSQAENQFSDNPLEQPVPGLMWDGQQVYANDVFRAVHDYFGHAKEGVGFRADGEENAWRSHAAMYSPLARWAMTTETRGQNSWLNYGPHAEANKTAKTEDTVFAPQKIGLLPEWVVNDGQHDDRPGIGHNGGPQMLGPKAEARMEREQAAERAQAVAAEQWSKTKLTKGEKAVLIPGELAALERGGKAPKRGRNGVDVAENELLPARAKAGMPVITERTPETAKQVADMLTKEALYHLSKSSNAVGWYESKLDTAIAMMAREFPELNDDPHALTTFKAILAITSNGQPVVKNFEVTADLYSGLRDRITKGDYALPTNTTFGGKTSPAMNAAFGAWNSGIKAMGIEGFTKFMATKLPVVEAEKIISDVTGEDFTFSGEGKKELVYGASILGPKIGNGFFSNLNGRFDMPTMDRWFMTTINRITGTIVKRGDEADLAQRAKKLAPLLDGLSNAPDLTNHLKVDDAVVRAARRGDPQAAAQFAKAVDTVENRQGFPRTGNGKLVDGSPVTLESDAIRKVSKMLHAAAKGDRAVAPEGPNHRRWLRSIMDGVVGNLRKKGIPITHADLQAVIWFPEQQFWQQRLGVGSAKTDADYEDAAVIHLLRKGLDGSAEAEYKDLGFSPAEIADKLTSRRALDKKLSKDTDQ